MSTLLNLLCTFVLVFATSLSIKEYIKYYKLNERRKYFNKIFKEIKLYVNENSLPDYIEEVNISAFLTVVSFLCLIPLKHWEDKKDILEMYLNTKIIDISQSPENNRVVHLLIEKEKLPTQIMWNNDFIDFDNDIINVGLSIYGVAGMNLKKSPHAFIAGETGSGKSNILKCMIFQAIQKNYDVKLIDFKRGVSFAQFNKLDVYYEYDTVLQTLQELVAETKNRLDLFRKYKVDNLTDYNIASKENVKRIIVFIDELAELLRSSDKDMSKKLNASIETLARLSRSAGIHLIMGVQRPDSLIVNGQIKNNTPFRLCGRFSDPEPSRIMLNSSDASKLPNNVKGRFLLKEEKMLEVQCFYFADSNKINDNTKLDLQESKIENEKEAKDKFSEINFNFSEKE